MIDKSKILYDKIDEELRNIILKLNESPYWSTTQCCAGHTYKEVSTLFNEDGSLTDRLLYKAHFYITFEVYNEEAFIELAKAIQIEVEHDTGQYLNILKDYDFITSNEDFRIRWRLSLGICEMSGFIVDDVLSKIHKALKRVVCNA